jgi:hypothetical protein
MIFLITTGVVVIFCFDSKRDIKLVKKYIQEYRYAKVLELVVKKKNNKNPELRQLFFYAAIKAKNFELANELLDQISSFSNKYKEQFYELIKLLYNNDQTDMMSQLLAKSGEIQLEESYLIDISRKQKNIDKEMQVLLMGRDMYLTFRDKLLLQKREKEASKIRIDKLEIYILKRYMNQANLFIAHQNYKSALGQMEKALELTIFSDDFDQTSRLLDEEKANYKFLLGTIYNNLGDKEKAWSLISESAKSGNLQARNSLEEAKRRYKKNTN